MPPKRGDNVTKSHNNGLELSQLSPLEEGKQQLQRPCRRTGATTAVTNEAEGEQYHPTAEKLRVKKTRHRRSGSYGTSNAVNNNNNNNSNNATPRDVTPRDTPRDSPSWARKVTTQKAILGNKYSQASFHKFCFLLLDERIE